MSHFSCLVIGDDHAAALQPFHEFECTGTDDQYIQEVDQTQEMREEFESDTRSMVRLADGTVVSAYDDICYREMTAEELKVVGPLGGSGWCGPAGISYTSKDWGDGRGYRAKACYVPEGAEKLQLPTKEHQTFAEWLEDYHGRKPVAFGALPDLTDAHKYGYFLVAENGDVTKVIDRTNPNKKWDWWEVGGRWSGFLKLNAGADGLTGRPGLMGSHFAKGDDRADQARKGDIDFAGMRAQAVEKSREKWEHCRAIVGTGDQPWKSWDSVREANKGDIDAAREQYNDQAAVVALKAADQNRYGWEIDDKLAESLDNYLQIASDKALCTFAVLHEGKWYERGEMGWWACVSNEKAEGEWEKEFAKLLDSLPDDALLTIVDCHI